MIPVCDEGEWVLDSTVNNQGEIRQAAPRLTIRKATPDDAERITKMRWLLFLATGRDEDTATRSIYDVHYSDWLRAKIAQGDYITWLAETAEGEIVATVGLWLMEWMPTLTTPDALQGYVGTVYTLETYRRQGLAQRMMEMLLDECRSRGLHRISLHASDQGRLLYETMGFKATNEMRLEF